MATSSSRTTAWWLLAALTATACAAIPYCLGGVWLKAYFGADRAHYLPFMSDTVHYWHEALNMARLPWDTGYYGYQETHAPLGRYGVHAPWVILAYALGVKLFGAAPSLPLVLGAVSLGGGILAYLALTRARPGQMLMILALCAVFGPFQTGLALVLPDMLNTSLAILTAGLVHRALEDGDDARPFWALLGVTACMVLIRKSWLPLFVLWIILHSIKHRRVWTRYSAATFLTAIVTSSLYTYFTAPYPYKETLQFFRITDLFNGGMDQFLHMASYSATSLFRIHREIFYGNMFGLLLLAVSLAGAFTALAGRRLFDALLLLLTPLMALLYTVGHLFNGIVAIRHLTPVFLLGLLVPIALRQKALFLFFLAANILLYPAFLDAFRQMTRPEYASSSTLTALDQLRQTLAATVRHMPGADPWCNTVATDDNYSQSLLALPPGMAFNAVRPDATGFTPPIRSRFLLVSDPAPFLPLLAAPPRVLLRTFDGATLLENTACACTAGNITPDKTGAAQ